MKERLNNFSKNNMNRVCPPKGLQKLKNLVFHHEILHELLRQQKIPQIP
jgi:hypothetical protein